jgi:hypothetical protein
MHTIIYQFKAPVYLHIAASSFRQLDTLYNNNHDLGIEKYRALAHIIIQDIRHSDKYLGLILSDPGLGTRAAAYLLAQALRMVTDDSESEGC